MAVKKKISPVDLAMKMGLKTSEFGAASTLIGYLSLQNQLTGEVGYAYAASGVAAAYIIGRCILKAIEILKQ